MRVTNSMMQNNALINMNKNKEYYNKYLEQYTTEKKIQKPSDNPTIAVRALKFRTNLVELRQYLNSNIPDAKSWMSETEEAMTKVSDVYTKMIDGCVQGANDTLEPKDRSTIVAQLKEYKGYIYEQQANADLTGRYLFTGYRTDVPLLFNEATSTTTYEITQDMKSTDLFKYSYTQSTIAYGASKSAADYAAEAPTYQDAYKAILSYSDIDSIEAISYTSGGVTTNLSVATISCTDPNAYDIDAYNTANGTNYDAIVLKETGEAVFTKATYSDILSKEASLSVSYKKTNFAENDVRPEHYFDCVATNNVTGKTLTYANPSGQQIKYEINFGQNLKVNTMACDAFDLSVGRAIDTIINVVNTIETTEQEIADVEKRIADTDESDKTTLAALKELQTQLENKRTMQNKTLQNTFSKFITTTQNAQSKLNTALADHGSRDLRLEMTENKLKYQELDFADSLSDNEDADLGDAYIKFNQADLLYQATLSATSKILKNTLLDFI